MKYLAVLSAAASRVPAFGRALTVKAVLPLSVAGVTLLSGVAVAVPSIAASVSSTPTVAAAASSCPGMHYESCPNMHYE